MQERRNPPCDEVWNTRVGNPCQQNLVVGPIKGLSEIKERDSNNSPWRLQRINPVMVRCDQGVDGGTPFYGAKVVVIQ